MLVNDFAVSSPIYSVLYIAQVKEKCGIKERENYNKPKREDLKQPICPIEKEEAIKDAFRYFQMI